MLTQIPPPPRLPPLFLCTGSATVLAVLKYLVNGLHEHGLSGFSLNFLAFVVFQ